MKKKLWLIPLGSLLVLLPALALAQVSSTEYQFRLFSDQTEAWLGVAETIMAIGAAWYAIRLAALSRGGIFEKIWKGLAVAVSLYAAFQITITLEQFHLVEFGGIDEVFDFLTASAFFATFYYAQKQLLRQISGK